MCIYTKHDFKDGYFTDNRKDKVKRFTKKFWSVLGSIIFGVGFVAWCYIMYLFAFAMQGA